MRNRLVITVALGVLLAVIAAGAVGARGGALDVGGANVDVNLPGGGDLPDVGDLLTCPDGSEVLDLADCPAPIDDGGSDPPTGSGGDDGTPTVPDPSDPTGTIPDPSDPTGTIPDDGTGTGPGSGSGNGSGDNPYGSGKGNKFSPGGGKDGEKKSDKPSGPGDRDPMKPEPDRNPDGSPTDTNPTTTVAPIGPAPIGVPNVVIDEFAIPPFLLPIYQACGTQYGVPWQVLASINRIETAFGTNLNVSSAGALGWMQFIPSTWEMYGTDANNDGRKDPYNPVDAICAAARYLKAAGAEDDLYQAIFAYNHADWYVDEVLLYAKQYGNLPSGIVDSLTGLTEGAHFPVAAKARYADDLSERAAAERATPTKGSAGNVADVIADSPTRRGINIFTREDAPVVAVNDGTIKKVGHSKRLGKYIVLQDNYGNEFTYAELGSISDVVPVPKERKLSTKDFELIDGNGDKAPTKAASKTSAKDEAAKPEAENTEDSRERLFALPQRPENLDRADLTGQLDALLGKGVPGYETFKSYFSGVLDFNSKTMDTRPLREGSKVVAGTILGRVAPEKDGVASHLNFAITPAGRGAQKIDPKPILDGWKLLEATAIYRAAGKNPFEDDTADVGQVLLMSKTQLQQRVLNDPNLSIYSCGRSDIETGQIDRRVLAMLEYLVQRGYRLTITSLKCGHSITTASGNISEHSTGTAVDIAQVNGIPILGNQGQGSITEAVINDLLQLQGSMVPHQIISLMEMGGPTFAMADHDDHIHVGYAADASSAPSDASATPSSLLNPSQWDRLLNRIGELDEPTVPIKPSKYSLPAKKQNKRSSDAHVGE